MMSAEETIREFWRIQDSGDYTRMVPLFAEDALLEDPIYGTFKGREAIAGFMAKMVEEMASRKTHFTLQSLAGGELPDGEGVAWAQWTAHTPGGDLSGCGLYRTRNGQLTYYRDYMNGGESGAS